MSNSTPTQIGGAKTPTVKIGEWFNESWALIRPVWLEVVVAILVMYLAILLGAALCILPGLIISGPLAGGLFVYCAKRLLGRNAEVSDVFKGFRRFADTFQVSLAIFLLPALVAAMLWLPAVVSAVLGSATPRWAQEFFAAIGGLAGCLGCIGVPMFAIAYPIIVGTLFVFAFPLVMFRNMKAIPALKMSISLVRPQFWNFLALLVANGVLVFAAQSVGALLCGVGALILTPLAYAAIALMQLMAYRDFVGITVADLAPYED